MRERQHDYELLFIVSPLQSTDEQIASTINRVQQAVTNLGGEVTQVNQSAPWGRRKFAYPIRKYAEGEASRRAFTEGFYVLLNLNLPTNQITEFERTLKLNDAVLRYLLTVVEDKGQQASATGAVPVSASVLDNQDEDEEFEDDEGDDQ